MAKPLSERALLVNLTVSQWSARKFDRQETQKILLHHGVSGDVARVNKNLLPGSEALEAVHKLTNKVRGEYYARSSPWGIDGINIISAVGYMDFVNAMRPLLAEWRDAARVFIGEYPQLRAKAQQLLNGLYKPEDYPELCVVERKFEIDMRFQPVPDNADWRVTLADEAMDDLRKQIEEQVRRSEAIATKDAWSKVYEVVKHAAERLADPEAIFRDSLVENAKKLCSILPGLNIGNDAAMEEMRQKIEGVLCATTPAMLRNSPTHRENTAADLKGILDQMSAFYQPA